MRAIDADALISVVNGDAFVSDGVKDYVRYYVGVMPTIEPERKVGTWKPVEEIPSIRKRFKRYCCSNCKKEGFDTWNYCPECGQRNREGGQNG